MKSNLKCHWGYMAACLLLLATSRAAAAEYAAREVFLIEWGDASNQLRIGEPSFEDVNNTPADSSDDWIEKGGGPSHGFVDNAENSYFSSYDFMQLKAFDSEGRIIFDYSQDTPGYNPDFFQGWLRKIYVDSQGRIYVLGGAMQDYIAVLDGAGNLLERLNPHGPNSGVLIASMFFNSDDAITILTKDKTYYTYFEGSFSPGGAKGWRAKDGYYYYTNLVDSALIRFIRYESPDLSGKASNLQETTREYEVPFAASLYFLGIDDALNLYIYEREKKYEKTRVLIFNTSFELIDQIVLPDRGNRYRWYMNPFMRPSDGNIYEFRCLDDGLHVVRWSKEK